MKTAEPSGNTVFLNTSASKIIITMPFFQRARIVSVLETSRLAYSSIFCLLFYHNSRLMVSFTNDEDEMAYQLMFSGGETKSNAITGLISLISGVGKNGEVTKTSVNYILGSYLNLRPVTTIRRSKG